MQNFTFYNPVKIYFGKDQIAALNEAIPKGKTILFAYGKGSIKKNGVYDQAMAALKGYKIVEFSGIEPNPTYETLMKAVEVARENKVDFILAVGGGSVIDGIKFVSAAINFNGDPWNIMLDAEAPINAAVPFGCILTLPGTGSEMNCGAVISRAATKDKLVFFSSSVFPQFSILDPVTTYSLPTNQTCNGIVDAYVHVMEQYLTYPADAPLQDRWAEGLLLTFLEEAPKVLSAPRDYNARANIMWCSTMALNGLLSVGVPSDWASHRIGHVLTAQFGLDHAETLAILLPNVMRVRRDVKKAKLLQYAKRVWNIDKGSDDQRIESAITKTEQFFRALNMKTKLRGYNIGEEGIPLVLEKLRQNGEVTLGEDGGVTLEVAGEILKQSL